MKVYFSTFNYANWKKILLLLYNVTYFYKLIRRCVLLMIPTAGVSCEPQTYAGYSLKTKNKYNAYSKSNFWKVAKVLNNYILEDGLILSAKVFMSCLHWLTLLLISSSYWFLDSYLKSLFKCMYLFQYSYKTKKLTFSFCGPTGITIFKGLTLRFQPQKIILIN